MATKTVVCNDLKAKITKTVVGTTSFIVKTSTKDQRPSDTFIKNLKKLEDVKGLKPYYNNKYKKPAFVFVRQILDKN